MKTLLVRRNKPNIFRIGKVTFYPGITELKNERDIAMVQSHKSYKAQLELKVMEEVSKEDTKKKVETADITDMNARDAIAIVQETLAIPVLQDMHQRETDKKSRSTVLTAILEQIEFIKKPPEDKDDKDKE
jgi:hypothetical protein